MKSGLNFDKTKSSALIAATLSCLVTNFLPAQATPVEPLLEEFSASEVNEAKLVKSLPQLEVGNGDGEIGKEEFAPSVVESELPEVEAAIASPDNTVVESLEPVPDQLAVATPTDSQTLPDQFGVELQTNEDSVEAFNETKVKDLTNPNYLQAQSLPEEGEGREPQSMDSLLQDPLEPELDENDPMSQVTNVTQLRDVSPGDWAYEALRSLVERYGCIAGYPDGTFRGNRAMTRYEFAAGLNACLQQMERIIAGRQPGTGQGDLESLRRLIQEFEAELATLGARVDNLEGRVASFEDNQFSTTTKLFGQAIFGIQGRTEDNEFQLAGTQVDEDTNVTLIDNVQLSLFTQFGPRSLLLTSFQAGNGNLSSFPDTLGNYVRLGYEGDNNNDLQLTDLNFRRLFGSNLAVIVGPEGVNPVNVFRGVNRIESAGSGPLSSFAQRNPIINVGNGSGGIGFDFQVATRLSLQGVYSASNPSEPDDNGIFGDDDGETSAGLQFVVSPTDAIDVSFQYINAYSPFGRLGTGVGDDQVVSFSDADERAPINTNAFGAGLEWRATPRITFGGWAGYTDSNFKDDSGDVQTFNWMAFLNFPDLFGEGNLGGIYVGQPPKIIDSDVTDDDGDARNVPILFADRADDDGGQPNTTTHVEVFYRFQVSDNISITPGVIVIFNPLHNDDNDTITIGAIRTTFTF
ncbi:MAG TPA: porin [Cyanobacteria bacterium UBA11162]|nr:porin [Cyanobacteria bacterium UBA11162]